MAPAPRVPEEHWEQVGQLYLERFDALRKAAAWQLGPEAHLAPDMVHEVFQDAALNWAKLIDRLPEERVAWLRAVLRNKIYDHWRATAKRVRALSDTDAAELEAPLHNTADQALDAIEIEACMNTINAMPEAQRQVAFLSCQGHWSNREIADHLGIAMSTVRVHLRNARREMSKQLDRPLPKRTGGSREGEGGPQQ